MRSALRQSLLSALAGSILVAGAACRDTTAPEASSILPPDSPALGKRKPPTPILDNVAPTPPTFTVTSVGTRHIGLTWSSTDDAPFISYQVKKDGVPITNGGLTWVSETSRTFTLLQPGTTYTFTAQAKDRFVNESGGNLSAISSITVTTRPNDGSDVTPPTQPSSVQAFGYGDLEMQVWWGASTDNVTPQNVIVYEIYVNGVHENTAIGKNMTPSAYGVPGNNVITVIAIDEAGNRSIAGETTLFIP